MDKKIQVVQKEAKKLTQNVYVETFSENIASFYVTIQEKKKTFPDLLTEIKTGPRGRRSFTGTNFLMHVTTVLRQLIRMADYSYGYEELIPLKFDERYVGQEPNATVFKACKSFRTQVNESTNQTMDKVNEVIKVVRKNWHNLSLLVQGCEKVMNELDKLAINNVNITYRYLCSVIEHKLLIKTEWQRAIKEQEYFKKHFPFIFSDVEAEKVKGEKRKADESEDSNSGKRRIDNKS